ncbi:MAG TPA: acyltransferase [Chitinophagaceae bacterium]|nr:acyltransferase [Chitinophagaceae bacterium]
MAYLDETTLETLNFKSLGLNVKISDKASIYGSERISLGNNVRIDDFCILSAGDGGIELGNYIHIAAYCSLIGKALIKMEDFSGLSSKVAIYSSSDDYSGNFLTNPTVPQQFTNVVNGPVILRKHVIIGVFACILPNVEIGAGSAVGSYSLVTKNIEPGVIVSGVPARFLKKRSGKIFELEQAFLQSENLHTQHIL